MTTERIDHAAEANRILDNLNPPDRFVFEQTKLAFAQVHATLALVEQQRIANLIELARFSHDAGDDQRIFTDLDGAIKWRNEAAEGLGLS